MIGFSSNVSSLIAHQNFLNTNANNVANVNTDGFVPSQTTLSNSGSAVQASSAKVDSNGSSQSQTDLGKEITDQIVVQNGHEVQGTAIRTQDQMLGTLLDILS